MRFALTILFALGAAGAGGFAAQPAGDGLTADQIVERNVAARGGAEAWRNIEKMAWTGHIESVSSSAPIPFLMLFKRPETTRFEVIAQGQHSARIFDGSKGWKLKPSSAGIPEVKDYTTEEVRFARDAAGLDGPLMEYRTKGVGIERAGRNVIEGHSALGLRVTLPSGQVQLHWIDASSFLELRYDRPTRDSAGRSGTVSVYYRDYQTLQGLTLPMTIETTGAPGQPSDKMVIERIALNPELDPAQFADPHLPVPRHHGVIVDTTKPPPPAFPGPAPAAAPNRRDPP